MKNKWFYVMWSIALIAVGAVGVSDYILGRNVYSDIITFMWIVYVISSNARVDDLQERIKDLETENEHLKDDAPNQFVH